MASCSFSPGRMPIILCPSSGAIALARSIMRIEGIFGMKISPPFIRSKFFSTKRTPCSSVIQKRVMRSSVIGSSFAPSAISLAKNGTTEPFEPTTLPYLATLKRVRRVPAMLFAAVKSLSLASFVAPYRFMGLQALSVLRAITFSTLHAKAAFITFCAPFIFVFIHSIGLYSAIGTCFIAAAWMTKSTSCIASFRRSSSRTSPTKKRIQGASKPWLIS